MLERVIFLFGYHNGPVAGVSAGTNTARYFRAPFRDDLDDYDSEFQFVELEPQERAEFERLFYDARTTDPACKDPIRAKFAKSISAKFDLLLQADSPIIGRSTPRIRMITGGAYGEYEMEWDTA